MAYVRAHGDYLTAAPEAWSKIFAWLDKFDLHISAGCGYGLVYGDPRTVSSSDMYYDACVMLPEDKRLKLAPGVAVQALPFGPFAKLRHVGNHAALRRRFASLFSDWAPSQGLTIDPRRPVIEIYLNDPKTCPEAELKTDLCFPIIVK